MRHATPDERLAALRILRNEDRDQATNTTSEQRGTAVGERPRNRLSAKFSRAFGGSRPASGVPTSRPVSQLPAAVEAPPPAPSSTSVTTEAAASTGQRTPGTTEAHTTTEQPADTHAESIITAGPSTHTSTEAPPPTEPPTSTTTGETQGPQREPRRQD